jgi:hypothetical protein
VTLRRAFQSNFVPALFLWGFAALILALYWNHAPTQSALNDLAQLKTRLGLWFVMPAQAFAAAVLPFCFQKFQSGTHRKTRLSHLPYLMLFFAFLGAATDLFYRFQAQIFGNSAQFSIIAPKVALDMLFYTPVLILPLIVWVFAFKDCNFQIAATRQYVGKNWVRERVLPIYLVNLLVWTPAVCVIYALPLALQFPIQAIVACLWSLILVVLTDTATEEK